MKVTEKTSRADPPTVAPTSAAPDEPVARRAAPLPPDSIIHELIQRATGQASNTPAGPSLRVGGYADIITAAREPRASSSGGVPRDVASAIQEGGRPLDAATRQDMEGTLGTQLGDVKVHTGPRASASAEARTADAYTFGTDVVFATGHYQPGTPTGDALLRHELTHVAEQRVGPPAVQRQPAKNPAKKADAADKKAPAGIDRDTHLDPDEIVEPLGPEPDDLAIGRASHTFTDSVSKTAPDTLLVPAWATRVDVATHVLGDAARVNDFYFVSAEERFGANPDQRAVRFYRPATLPPALVARMRTSFEARLADDVAATLAQLGAGSASDRDLAERVASWGDYSAWTDAVGASYFERFLAALEKRSVGDENGLAALLDASGNSREIIEKTITLRSRRSIGYRVTDRKDSGYGALQSGTIVGRWFSTNDQATAQIVVHEWVAAAADRREAEIQTRSAAWTGHKLLIYSGPWWIGYAVWIRPDLSSAFPAVPGQEDGRWHWYYPDSIYIGPSEMANPDAWTRPGNQQSFENTLVDGALFKSIKLGAAALYGLDFGALSLASVKQRAEIFKAVIDAKQLGERDAIELLGRTVLSTPSEDFPALARALDDHGMMAKLVAVRDPKLVQSLMFLGQSFTLQGLQAMPLDAQSFSDPTVLYMDPIAEGNAGRYYTAESKAIRVHVVPPEKWKAGGAWTTATGVPVEAGAPGDKEHDVTRTGIQFTYGTFPGGGWGDQAKHLKPLGLTRVFLPYELLTVETSRKGKLTRRIVSALEASLLQGDPSSDLSSRNLSDFVDVLMMVQAGLSVARLGSIGIRAMAASSLRAGLELLAKELTSTAGKAAVRGVVDFALMNAAKYAMDNADELDQTTEGRAFKAVLTSVIAILAVRDIGHLIESGALTKLFEAGQAALGRVSGAAKNGVGRTLQSFRAAQLAWRNLKESGGLVMVTAEGGFKVWRARVPGEFLNAYRQAEAIAAREAFQVGLGTGKAGAATAARADEALGRLEAAAGLERNTAGELVRKGRGTLSDAEAEAGRAYRDIMRRAAALKPDEATKLLDAVEGLLTSAKGYTASELAPFLRAAMSGAHGDAIVFLDHVKWLAARGLTKSGFTSLGAKALRGPATLDLAWLRATVEKNGMSGADLDFLARDPKTPWSLFKRAALDPLDEKAVIAARARARGAAAELLVNKDLSAVVAGQRIGGRQIKLAGGSEIDFMVVSTDGRGVKRGLEIKGFTPETWDDAIGGYNLGKIGPNEPGRKIDVMLKQLRDAAAEPHWGKPILGVTDGMKKATRAKLKAIISARVGKGVEIVDLPEKSILATGKRLREGLGVP